MAKRRNTEHRTAMFAISTHDTELGVQRVKEVVVVEPGSSAVEEVSSVSY